jgi:hypothetical protein
VNFSPPIGAIAFGKSGAGYPVIEVRPDRIVLKRADGPWAVNPVAIVRWELPAPRLIQVGDRVRLKNTQLEFTIAEIYSVRDGSDNGEPTFEQWARLQTDDNRPAHWKTRQLEVMP